MFQQQIEKTWSRGCYNSWGVCMYWVHWLIWNSSTSVFFWDSTVEVLKSNHGFWKLLRICFILLDTINPFTVSVVYPFPWALLWTYLVQRCNEGNSFNERFSLPQGNCEVEQYFATSTPWTSTRGKTALGYGALQLLEHFISHFSSLFLLKPFVIKLQPEVEELTLAVKLHCKAANCTVS